jgi:hypothetical protein
MGRQAHPHVAHQVWSAPGALFNQIDDICSMENGEMRTEVGLGDKAPEQRGAEKN